MFRSHRPTQTEVALGLANVAADLFTEGFWVGPAHLGAQSFEEGQGEGRLLGKGLISFKGMKVEQVGFDRERVCTEGGAIADVGDGVEGFAV